MNLVFYKGTDSLIDVLIRKRTNSNFCHVELQFTPTIVFPKGETFSSDLGSGGCRFTDGSQVYAPMWLSVPLKGVTPIQEQIILNFCNSVNGCKYDLLGCVDFFFDSPDKDVNQWFCSGVCTQALQKIGLFTFLEPTMTSPQELFIAAMEYSADYQKLMGPFK